MKLSETDVFNAIRQYLLRENFRVLQLVPPGGQAPLSVTFYDKGRQRTCFPDLFALGEGVALLGELKAGFSTHDYDKICTLLNQGEAQVRDLLRRVTGVDSQAIDIIGVLCHSDSRCTAVPMVHQIIFGIDGSVRHLHPLVAEAQ